MNKIVATLIAGLFATSVYAQTTATPATPATHAEVKADKKAAKAEAKEEKADVKAATTRCGSSRQNTAIA